MRKAELEAVTGVDPFDTGLSPLLGVGERGRRSFLLSWSLESDDGDKL